MGETPPTPMSARQRVGHIIFEADTPAGKGFDVLLLVAILGSILALMLESVPELAADDRWRTSLRIAEWVFTALFSLEYLLRVWSARKRMRYVFSFFGIVDLLSILPTFISLLIPGSQSLAVVRAFRLLRAFRVFKLAHFLKEAHTLRRALIASWPKVAVFLMTVLVLIVIVGSAMYLIEGPESGFTSIPTSMYWAVVTITTVGYGDIAPQTALGKAIAAGMMIMGYALIVVPMGVLTSELNRANTVAGQRICESCGAQGHVPHAKHCHGCAAELPKIK